MSLNESIAREVMGWEGEIAEEWQPNRNIAQAFLVLDEVFSWEWDNPPWIEITFYGSNAVVELLDSFESISLVSGGSLPEVICKVALWAWRCGRAERRIE